MSDAKACTVALEDGTLYDLSPLSSAKADYEVDIGNRTGTWKLNVCRAVVDELWNVDDAGEVGGFIRREDHGDFSLGAVSTELKLSPSTNDPMLLYTKGTKCRGSDELASTAIRFICTREEFGAGQPKLIASLPAGDEDCHFFMEWKTHVACPTNAKAEVHGAHVLAFVGLVFVAILTWFGGHTIYNRFVLGRRGLDQLPLSRCTRPPGVRLPHPATSDQTPPRRGRWNVFQRRSQRAGYNHVRADEHDEEDHLAARFSLDDDDDHDDAQVLGGEMEAWRRSDDDQAPARPSYGGNSSSAPGVHQGLVRL